MGSRPPTPPYVPFGIRRFNRISAETRTGQGCCSILPVRVFLLRLLAGHDRSLPCASRLFDNCSPPKPAIPVFPVASDFLPSFWVSSTVSRCSICIGGVTIRPILALLSSCLLFRSSPTIPGCRPLRSPSPFGHFCPDCGKSVLLSSSVALYMISFRQARVLPPSFFRSHLTMDTLDLSYVLPTAGWTRDFHPIERALTGRTHKQPFLRFQSCKNGCFNDHIFIPDWFFPVPYCRSRPDRR